MWGWGSTLQSTTRCTRYIIIYNFPRVQSVSEREHKNLRVYCMFCHGSMWHFLVHSGMSRLFLSIIFFRHVNSRIVYFNNPFLASTTIKYASHVIFCILQANFSFGWSSSIRWTSWSNITIPLLFHVHKTSSSKRWSLKSSLYKHSTTSRRR